MFVLPLEHLPPPAREIVSFLLLEHIPHADLYLALACCALTALVFIQLRAFARPPPVPLKKLPRRPTISILFKPDDITSTRLIKRQQVQEPETQAEKEQPSRWRSRIRSSLSNVSVQRMTRQIFRTATATQTTATTSTPHQQESRNNGFGSDRDVLSSDGGLDNQVDVPPGPLQDEPPVVETLLSDDEDLNDEAMDDFPVFHATDLPDSFAPLLSSSQVEVIKNQLTADLIHAVHVEGGVRLRHGRHEIPLDKDSSRPQFVLDVPKGGCRLSAVAMVGSDGFSMAEDLDVTKKTTSRSKPMVKHAGLVLDPPLPLVNVAPTLIHFPTLFEDNFVPTLRRIQIVRHAMDFIISISSFLEKCLWIIESKCQIHLSKVRVMPLYKGRSSDADNSPEWRLSLAFSGHVLLFGWIPIPFVSVTLPTFIIPQPHSLLEYLMTAQPLASARLRRENIAEQRIALAMIDTIESWNIGLKLVATPPAAVVDVTLPGGVSVAFEMGLGRDPLAGKQRSEADPAFQHSNLSHKRFAQRYRSDSESVNSMSSWSTNLDVGGGNTIPYRRITSPVGSGIPPFDANQIVPWFLEVAAKGSISHEKLSLHILKLVLKHEESSQGFPVTSQFATRGSLAVWKIRPDRLHRRTNSNPEKMQIEEMSPHAIRKRASFGRRRANSFTHPELETEDSPSVAAILLFPDEIATFHSDLRIVQYDYAFDVFEESRVDALTLSIGATHPMLKGGTMVTVILDSIYAFGSVAAREDAVLDPNERKKKRNILRHLPATDFTFGIQNVYIPPESNSYSDDGQTLFLPDVEGGRMMIRVFGGVEAYDDRLTDRDIIPIQSSVTEGIKVVADFEVGSLVLRTEGNVKEFPELDIFEGDMIRTMLNGIIGGSVCAHLRPQELNDVLSTTGPNVLNPLEAYEIDFSGSNLTVKMKEYTTALGHRRIIFPTESTVVVKVVESVVDMGFEGKTQCELSWDFQGLSPILQVTALGASPEDAVPENKQQVSLLIAPLRQGRLSFHVSSVGGIRINKAVTSREDKEGLYDWKFFNALVSPDNESPGRILDVLHDKRSMDRLLQVTRLINEDMHRILRYALQQVWRAKEIFDREGVTDPGHAIPMYKMARLISLFLSGEIDQVDSVMSIVRRVVDGEGLDVVKVKDLLRQNLEHYDDWAPEIDRLVRWAAVACGPMSASQPYVEEDVLPLAELLDHSEKFRNIPSASQLYQTLLDKRQLPLEPSFSNLISRVAPYLSFRQVSFILQARVASDWQPADLRRVRYVHAIKRKVQDIAENYGGLSFLPQSFMVSVFLGEATRTSLRASKKRVSHKSTVGSTIRQRREAHKSSTFTRLRRRRVAARDGNLRHYSDKSTKSEPEEFTLSPAERVASMANFVDNDFNGLPSKLVLDLKASEQGSIAEEYELGDSLLGPQDVAILLQAGLTSVMKASTVVQLNQRMLLDLICSQPRSFAVAVLAEIGTPSGQGSPRSLTSALMALLELDQTAFKTIHQIDMHALLESWLPGLKIPRREDYMAGGRWARQSYYEALYTVSTSILGDAETYMALKGHIQRVRHSSEADPLPCPREELSTSTGFFDETLKYAELSSSVMPKIDQATFEAKSLVASADELGKSLLEDLLKDEESVKAKDEYKKCISLYVKSFDACKRVLSLDKHSFHADWFRSYYKRNYDALMIKSMYDNVMEDVDNVRHWLQALLKGAKHYSKGSSLGDEGKYLDDTGTLSFQSEEWEDIVFLEPERCRPQVILDAIIDSTIFELEDREIIRRDPLVRLLIENPPGHYSFTIISAMGVITDGKKGIELQDAFIRLKQKRGVEVIRADTGTARSFEYNASKIEEAIEVAVKKGRPYGLLGYSQGCANALMAESMLLSGSPEQQKALSHPNSGLVCRQLLFSAANGSFHGPAMDKKVQRLIVMCEEFFKYQQGYVSRALSTSVLELLISTLDSAHFHKIMGGAQSFLPDGCRAFWREAQHLSTVPTCTLRGIMEAHTTPESLEMLANLLTKQSGSPRHDSQVHAFDAVGYPVYYLNRNGRLLRKCAVGEGAIQRTHHWSPLSDEVEFVRTPKDIDVASFDCAKDRHVFPWVEVNARFGFIKILHDKPSSGTVRLSEVHPSKLIQPTKKEEQEFLDSLEENFI